MTTSYNLYKSQYKKAKETLDVLIINRTKIELKLESDHINPSLHKELRNVILDIKITRNELEQAESDVKQCELK